MDVITHYAQKKSIRYRTHGALYWRQGVLLSRGSMNRPKAYGI